MHSKCCLSLQGAALLFVGSASAFPLAFPDGPAGPLPIPRPGSDGSYAGDNYFQYINVPAHKTFEWGYRRGNPDHNREEYLSQKDHTFKAKVNNWPNMSTLSIYCNCILFQLKWHDSYDGHGEHYFDYNHGGGYKEPVHHEPAYAPPAPAYSAGSEPEGTYVAAPGDARNKRSLPYPEVYYILA